MNGLPYYKAYPRDFIEGTIGMSFELKGAYRLVLDLIYMQGGKLPDDDRYISGLLGCSVRKWVSFKKTLVSMGKVEIISGFISNYRAVIELESLSKLQDKNAENRSTPNKNKALPSPKANHTEAEAEPDKSKLSSLPKDAAIEEDTNLRNKLIEAAGESNIQGHGVFDLSAIRGLIVAGADLETDILPTIRARCQTLKHPVSYWSYFTKSITEAYNRRIEAGRGLAAPKQKIDDDYWNKRLTFCRERRIWDTPTLGPIPGSIGCRVPAHLLETGDGNGWKEIGISAAA